MVVQVDATGCNGEGAEDGEEGEEGTGEEAGGGVGF